MILRSLVVPLVVALAACSSTPADVAGNYSLSLTSRENGCMFANWTVGETTTGVPMVITQEGAMITGTVTGAAGTYLDIILGGHVFTDGSVDGNDFEMTLFGTTQGTMGNCSYNVNATARGSIAGGVLTGELDYTTQTNGSPECGALEGCHSIQEFNGTRPPQ